MPIAPQTSQANMQWLQQVFPSGLQPIGHEETPGKAKNLAVTGVLRIAALPHRRAKVKWSAKTPRRNPSKLPIRR